MSEYITPEEYKELVRLWEKADTGLRLIYHTHNSYRSLEYENDQISESGIQLPYTGEDYGDTYIGWEEIPSDWIMRPLERLEEFKKEQEEAKKKQAQLQVEWERKQYETLRAKYELSK